MEPLVLATGARACRLLKHTLMRVRWNGAAVSTILEKSFMAKESSWAEASSLLARMEIDGNKSRFSF